jgi:hypothetical protein
MPEGNPIFLETRIIYIQLFMHGMRTVLPCWEILKKRHPILKKGLELKALYAPGYFYLGELYSAAGRPVAALGKLSVAETLFQEMGMAYWLAKTQEVVESFQT